MVACGKSLGKVRLLSARATARWPGRFGFSVTGSFGTDDLQLEMMPGTSPSMDDDDIMFQGTNGDLWDWIPGFPTGSGHDLHRGMMADTSLSTHVTQGSEGHRRRLARIVHPDHRAPVSEARRRYQQD
jgi:hypothetical protein